MIHALRRKSTIPVALVTLVAALVVPATATAGAGAATCFGRVATIMAQPGVVTIGTSGVDVIIGTAGNDVIRAKGGADFVCAGGGNDKVYGGYGPDHIHLGSGADVVKGGPGSDYIDGSSGRDVIRGRSGHDTIRGGEGIDACWGGKGRDTLQSCNEPAAATLSSGEMQMVNLVQDLRSRHGAGRLEVSVDISDVARTWSTQLPGSFEHNSGVGSQIPSGWRSWGENIAYNGSVTAAFDALVNSSGHFRNMVDSDYTHIGVGVHVENGRVYVTQVFATY